MTAPDMRRGSKRSARAAASVVVVDPRRTETADARRPRTCSFAPGTDAVLLLALAARAVRRRSRTARPAGGVRARRGRPARAPRRRGPPERAAGDHRHRGAETSASSRALLATTPRAVLYGRDRRVHAGVRRARRRGWSTRSTSLTGHLDEPGGADVHDAGGRSRCRSPTKLGYDGGFARWHSRVRGLPEFGGELPVAAFAEEIETPGEGQIRALVTSRGQSRALDAERARGSSARSPALDFMVSIDPYLNETTRHAHVILPPATRARARRTTMPRSTRSSCATSRSTRRPCSSGPPTRATTGRSAWRCGRGLGAPRLLARARRAHARQARAASRCSTRRSAWGRGAYAAAAPA